MNKKIIRNARIITMNERLDILPNGNILIENGKISAITTQSLEDTDAEITDAEGMFLLPGLINTHTHLPMTMHKLPFESHLDVLVGLLCPKCCEIVFGIYPSNY